MKEIKDDLLKATTGKGMSFRGIYSLFSNEKNVIVVDPKAELQKVFEGTEVCDIPAE